MEVGFLADDVVVKIPDHRHILFLALPINDKDLNPIQLRIQYGEKLQLLEPSILWKTVVVGATYTVKNLSCLSH